MRKKNYTNLFKEDTVVCVTLILRAPVNTKSTQDSNPWEQIIFIQKENFTHNQFLTEIFL